MTFVDPREIDRFTKILGLLASDQVGERAAAAAKATSFLTERHLHWSDLGETLQRPPVVIHDPAPVRPARTHQMDARRCLQSGIGWTMKERQFLNDMSMQMRRPSDRQGDWLDGLSDRVTRYNKGAGHA